MCDRTETMQTKQTQLLQPQIYNELYTCHKVVVQPSQREQCVDMAAGPMLDRCSSLVLLRYVKYCFRSINDTINQNYRDKDTIR